MAIELHSVLKKWLWTLRKVLILSVCASRSVVHAHTSIVIVAFPPWTNAKTIEQLSSRFLFSLVCPMTSGSDGWYVHADALLMHPPSHIDPTVNRLGDWMGFGGARDPPRVRASRVQLVQPPPRRSWPSPNCCFFWRLLSCVRPEQERYQD